MVRKSAKLWKIIQATHIGTPRARRVPDSVIPMQRRARRAYLWSKKSYCLCPGCFIAVHDDNVRTMPGRDPGDVNSPRQARFSPDKIQNYACVQSQPYAKRLRRAEIIY